MILINVLNSIVNHPLNKNKKLNAIFRFIKWQINNKLNPYPIIYSYAEKSKFIISKGLTGATGNFYCGLHEFEDMSFVLHSLRDSDIFVDIGANVGSYTLLAASEIGSKTISIEPVPKTFEILEANISINKIQSKVDAFNVGLGSEKGQLKFTKSLDTMNHVVVGESKNTIDVSIVTFDNLIKIQQPTFIKIDVEGFETEVLKGMANALKDTNLKAIIIELNGAGERYGYDDKKIHKKLLSHNFTPYKYSPFDRKLIEMSIYGPYNTIYIRDLDFVKKRIISAKKFKIHGHQF